MKLALDADNADPLYHPLPIQTYWESTLPDDQFFVDVSATKNGSVVAIIKTPNPASVDCD